MCAQKEKWKGKKITGLSSFSIIHHHSYNLVQVIFLYTNKFTKYQAFNAYYAHWGQGHVKKGSNKQCRQLLMRYVKLWLLLLPANRVDLSKCITFNHTDKVIDPLTREWQMSMWPIVVHLISSHIQISHLIPLTSLTWGLVQIYNIDKDATQFCHLPGPAGKQKFFF